MKQHAESRFALLGINSDENREELKETIRKENITWRSWWDEGSKDGPIHTKWQVTERPAIFVLDAKGVIRFKGVTGAELDSAIDLLLKETLDKKD